MLVPRLSEALTGRTSGSQSDDPLEIIRLAAELPRLVSAEEDDACPEQRDVRFLVATVLERRLAHVDPDSQRPFAPFLAILHETGIPDLPGVKFGATNLFLHAALQVAALFNTDPDLTVRAMRDALSSNYPNTSQLWAGLHHTASSRGHTELADRLQAQFGLPASTQSSWIPARARTARQVHDLHVEYAHQPLPVHKPRLALGQKPIVLPPNIPDAPDALDAILGPVPESSPLKITPNEPTLHGVSFYILDRFFEGHGLPYIETGSELAGRLFRFALDGARSDLIRIEKMLQTDSFRRDFSAIFAVVEARLAYAAWEMKTNGTGSPEITFALNKARELINYLFLATRHPRAEAKREAKRDKNAPRVSPPHLSSQPSVLGRFERLACFRSEGGG